MDVVVRRWRPLLIAAAALGALPYACAPRPPAEAVGRSTAARGTPTPIVEAGASAREGGLPPGFPEGFTRVGAGRFPSLGHAAGRWEALVFADPAAKEALDAPDAALPVGATFVQQHFERAGDGGAGPTMMMQKREEGYDRAHGDIRWVVVTASGETVQDGPAPTCSACHDDAPRDRYFPVK